MRNLVIHVADNSMEKGLRAFFQRNDWPVVLDCAEFQIGAESSNDIFRIPRFKDGGVWKNAGKNLSNHLEHFERALIILDEDFDPWPGAAKIRADIENEMLAAGWPRENFEAIVIQPMMEAWLWTDDDSVASAFGIPSFTPLRNRFIEQGLWTFGEWKPKPQHMKKVMTETMNAGWRLMRDVVFQTILSELPKEALDQCVEPGFVLLRETLQRWFPKPTPMAETGTA